MNRSQVMTHQIYRLVGKTLKYIYIDLQYENDLVLSSSMIFILLMKMSCQSNVAKQIEDR